MAAAARVFDPAADSQFRPLLREDSPVRLRPRCRVRLGSENGGHLVLDGEEHLRYLYDRFNARDMEAVFAKLHLDVVWANGMEGGHVHGHDGIRDYRTRQWSQINPHVNPFASQQAGITGSKSIVRDLEAKVLSDKMVRHVFVRGGAVNVKANPSLINRLHHIVATPEWYAARRHSTPGTYQAVFAVVKVRTKVL